MTAMHTAGLHIFLTALGPCGIAWRGEGIVGLQLPEGDHGATLARLRIRFPDLNEATATAVITASETAIIALLDGGNPDLDFIPLDMQAVPEFHQRVYAIARAIPRGTTRTYGDLARQLGDVALSRAVGQALGANPFAPVVPCHRVLGAHGLGGFSAHGGGDTKLRMLAIEETKGLQLSMF
jgi:methylated-DNA-[protein]-cysteine S-methyltransferase